MLVSRFISRTLVCTIALSTAVVSAPAFADLELPQPSPGAKVSQRVGITDVSVDYSSPAVNGRKIFGGLVPWDKPWRTGANSATKITFSRDITFGGVAVPAGTYSIVSIPSEKNWQIALNKDLTINVADQTYNNKDELVRVKATLSTIPHRERMLFVFSNTTDAETSLDLEWDKTRVSVPIKVDPKYVETSIKGALDNAWRPFANSARYVAEHKEYARALQYIDASISIQSTWFNNWIKADILHKEGKNQADACKFAQTAWDMGEKDQGFFFKDQVQKALTDWKCKK